MNITGSSKLNLFLAIAGLTYASYMKFIHQFQYQSYNLDHFQSIFHYYDQIDKLIFVSKFDSIPVIKKCFTWVTWIQMFRYTTFTFPKSLTVCDPLGGQTNFSKNQIHCPPSGALTVLYFGKLRVTQVKLVFFSFFFEITRSISNRK